MRNRKLQMLCEGAILVALAQILSMLKLWEMPWGGSITLGMLPIFLCRALGDPLGAGGGLCLRPASGDV